MIDLKDYEYIVQVTAAAARRARSLLCPAEDSGRGAGSSSPLADSLRENLNFENGRKRLFSKQGYFTLKRL
jgi:hypothetical protein